MNSNCSLHTVIFRPVASLVFVLFILSHMAGFVQAQGYLLQPGDVIEVTVIEDPNLNRRTLIGPDGRINLPLAGTVVAGGRTIEAVQASVRRNLANSFVAPPTVTVSLVATAPPPLPDPPAAPEPEEEFILWQVYVLGEVRNPGRFEYDSEEPITILQALAYAGGPDVFAARNRIQIRRFIEGTETVLLFDYEALEKGDGFSLNGVLEDGDVIVVPERGLFD